jgi:hypothetical protein
MRRVGPCPNSWRTVRRIRSQRLHAPAVQQECRARRECGATHSQVTVRPVKARTIRSCRNCYRSLNYTKPRVARGRSVSLNVNNLRILLVAPWLKSGSIMLQTIFALTVVGLILAVAPGTSRAAPIAPLTSEVTVQHHSGMTVVHWIRRCWRSHLGVVHCRRALGL